MYVLGITASATAASIPDFALGTIGANVTSDGIKVYKYIKYDTGGGSVAAVADQVA